MIPDNLDAKLFTVVTFIVSTNIPLAPAAENGLIKAVGIPSTHRVSAPKNPATCRTPLITASKVPLTRNREMAANIPTK